ncbi:MAG: cyclic nucleotide-binding domain-containing protein [Anaerolineales bacterium]|nr:cyclic nucleotide-binding domain-containing protein [Anaerolineales bacterium]MCB9422373.1 cyclic nucleotide-binding domain-containing protein [Ardenticatenaceae bacterium]
METPDISITFLSDIPLFSRLKERQLKLLANRFVQREYAPNQYILTQGEGGAGLFTITSGRAEVVLEMADGSTTQVDTLGPKDYIGEISLLDDGPRSASVIATEKTECLVLNRPDFITVMNMDAEMGVFIARELARRIRISTKSLGSK